MPHFGPLASWSGFSEFFSSLDKETWDKWYHYGKTPLEARKGIEKEIGTTYFTRGYVRQHKNIKIISFGYLNNITSKTCRLGLVVSPEYRNQGIGLEHTKYLIEEAKKRKIESISLSVDTANTPAFKLWKRAGFRIVKHFEDNPKRVEMTLNLVSPVRKITYKEYSKKDLLRETIRKMETTRMNRVGEKLYAKEGEKVKRLLSENLYWHFEKAKRPMWLQKIFKDFKEKKKK